MAYLTGNNMTGGYGGADILTDCTISVNKGEIVVIVGPNGAGKSTVMKAMLGMIKLREGQILLENSNITNLSPQDRVSRGMAFVPQNKNVFTGMTVQENLEMGAHLRKDNIDETIGQIYELFPVLRKKRKQLCRSTGRLEQRQN